MAVSELLRQKREEILRICGKYRVRNVRVFGSAAGGEATAGSDIDLLVEFEPGLSLLDQAELEALLGCSLDAVGEKGLYLLRRRIPPMSNLARILGCIERIKRFTAGGGNAFSLTAVYASRAVFSGPIPFRGNSTAIDRGRPCQTLSPGWCQVRPLERCPGRALAGVAKSRDILVPGAY